MSKEEILTVQESDVKKNQFLKAVEYTNLENENDEKTIDYLFKLSCKNINLLNEKPNNETLLNLYGLYKQSTNGNCDIEKPNFLDFKGVKKWEAWNNLHGLKNIEAKKKYILFVELLIKNENDSKNN